MGNAILPFVLLLLLASPVVAEVFEANSGETIVGIPYKSGNPPFPTNDIVIGFSVIFLAGIFFVVSKANGGKKVVYYPDTPEGRRNFGKLKEAYNKIKWENVKNGAEVIQIQELPMKHGRGGGNVDFFGMDYMRLDNAIFNDGLHPLAIAHEEGHALADSKRGPSERVTGFFLETDTNVGEIEANKAAFENLDETTFKEQWSRYFNEQYPAAIGSIEQMQRTDLTHNLSKKEGEYVRIFDVAATTIEENLRLLAMLYVVSKNSGLEQDANLLVHALRKYASSYKVQVNYDLMGNFWSAVKQYQRTWDSTKVR